MERMYGIAAITSVCILVILIGVLKKNAEVLLNFAARTVVCFLCSHFLNSFFLARGLDVAVGINLISFLTYGTLVSVEWQHLWHFIFTIVVILHKGKNGIKKRGRQ